MYGRLGRALDDPPSVHEWVAQAAAAKYGVASLRELPRTQRQIFFQKVCGALLALEDEGDIAFVVNQRTIVQHCFARFFAGAVLAGPPWRLDPYEPLPSYDEWVAETAAALNMLG